MPKSVFNYAAPIWVVAVHAAFVVLESVASCFIARSFFDNVIGLERIVRARTEQLDERNRDMRMVLDNVSQGFVTIDQTGAMAHERSKVLDTWFGTPGETSEVFDLFARISPEFADSSRAAFSQVIDGILPLELALDQMPRSLDAGDRHLDVAYLPIAGADAFLVVVTESRHA